MAEDLTDDLLDEAGEPGDDPEWENLSAQEQRDSATTTIKVVITSQTVTP